MTEWDPEFAITENELSRADKLKTIAEFHVISTQDGFYIMVQIGVRKLHLATRRDLEQPKIFKSFDRLLTSIQEKFPGVRLLQLHL